MSSIVTEQFHQSLRASPSGQQVTGTMFDEIYGSLETSTDPLDRALQMIAEFHGPWSGASNELFKFMSFIASMMNSPLLRALAKSSGESACIVERAIALTPPSLVGRQNNQTAAIMPTPLLREFTKRVQNIHPAINTYIAMHQQSFPYFAPISEEVGSFAHITTRTTETDPSKWAESNRSGCGQRNSRIHTNQKLKMVPSIYHLMDGGERITNAMFVRNLQADNNMAVLHPNYANEAPIAHGHNFAMDVHNAKRRQAAVPACMAVVAELAGDLLRLVNKFFCLTHMGKYETESFNITFYRGPNNEPVTFVTDNKGRLFSNDVTSDTINDPTNDRVINTKAEYIKEKQ